MRSLKNVILGMAVLAVISWGVSVGLSQPDLKTKEVMKLKLKLSQGVLEGIALEDYKLIADNARRLGGLTTSAGWAVRQTKEYQALSKQYQKTANQLQLAAKKQNVDAATIAYFQLTVSCVNCHRYLKDARLASLRLR